MMKIVRSGFVCVLTHLAISALPEKRRHEVVDALDDEHIEDDVLRLIFTACHPVLPTTSRTALTLKLVGGLIPQPAVTAAHRAAADTLHLRAAHHAADH